METNHGLSQAKCQGHLSWTPKKNPWYSQTKVLPLVASSNKNETQQLVGLFGYWRPHIPNLSVLLLSLVKVTSKPTNFKWSPLQQQALEALQQVVVQALLLEPLIPVSSIKLQMSKTSTHADWSLWKEKTTTGMYQPLTFWIQKLLEAAPRYTPFKQQLLACY